MKKWIISVKHVVALIWPFAVGHITTCSVNVRQNIMNEPDLICRELRLPVAVPWFSSITCVHFWCCMTAMHFIQKICWTYFKIENNKIWKCRNWGRIAIHICPNRIQTKYNINTELRLKHLIIKLHHEQNWSFIYLFIYLFIN